MYTTYYQTLGDHNPRAISGWDILMVTDHRPTGQEITNAIVERGENPLLYRWGVVKDSENA